MDESAPMDTDAMSFMLQAPVNVALGARTDPGRRRTENQDDFLVADFDARPGPDWTVLKPEAHAPQPAGSLHFRLAHRGALLIVADGMGGASAGGLASRLATLWLNQEFTAAWCNNGTLAADRFARALRGAVERTNLRVYQQAQQNPEFDGMGCTVTAAGIFDGHAYIAQIGDSRGYLIRGGVCTQITRDQSVVQALIDAGTMTEADAERSDGRSVILQALGTRDAVDVDLTYQQLCRGDLLLLCSDGLSRVVLATEMAGIALSGLSPQLACESLVALANERGGPDNITVVLARFDGNGLQPPAPGDTVRRRAYDAELP
jgi:PPM family protein phosphatase